MGLFVNKDGDIKFGSIIGTSIFGILAAVTLISACEEVPTGCTGVQVVIVTEGSPITSVDDLYAEGASYKVGVQLGTTGDIYASDEFGDRVTQYNNGNEAVLALQAGDIDCIIIDNEPAKAFVKANEGLVVLESTYADEDYAACFAQENDALREAVNTAIEELIMDGTIDAIIEKYIPTT